MHSCKKTTKIYNIHHLVLKEKVQLLRSLDSFKTNPLFSGVICIFTKSDSYLYLGIFLQKRHRAKAEKFCSAVQVHISLKGETQKLNSFSIDKSTQLICSYKDVCICGVNCTGIMQHCY